MFNNPKGRPKSAARTPKGEATRQRALDPVARAPGRDDLVPPLAQRGHEMPPDEPARAHDQHLHAGILTE